MQTEQSSEEESLYQPSRCNRSHHSRISKTDDKKNQLEQDMKDFEEKYKKMVLFMENANQRLSIS
jgi:hypothetical protein